MTQNFSSQEWEPGIPLYRKPTCNFMAAPMFVLKEEAHGQLPAADSARWPTPDPNHDLDSLDAAHQAYMAALFPQTWSTA